MWQCFICGGEVGEEFNECTQCSEKKEDSDSKTKAAKAKKKTYTVIIVLCAILWWLLIWARNPSGFGTGIRLGHLLQWSVILIITAVIIKFIWRKKNYTDFKMPKHHLSSDEHIVKIYNDFSKNRKDLSESGIIFKIEEDYKYEEEFIRQVLNKPKESF